MEKIGILTKTVEAKESTQIAQLREQIELEVLASFEKNGENDTAEGYDNTKLHIGDFINYTAGTWTKEEIEAIGANNSTSLPQNAYQFGGFVEGSSRATKVFLNFGLNSAP